MVANPEKFQIIFLGIKDDSIGITINNNFVKSTSQVKLLGITIDQNLTFLPHITEICKKANIKTKALLRIRNNLSDKQAKMLYNAFIFSNINYCPLVWMFTNKQGNNLLRTSHFRALKALFNDFRSDYNNLLIKANEKSIHHFYLSKLAIEVFMSLTDQRPPILKDLYEYKSLSVNLRRGKLLKVPKTKNTNAWLYRSVLLWNHLPKHVHNCTSKTEFEKTIQNLTFYCNCKICG